VISLNEHRQKGWLIKGIKNRATIDRKPEGLNMIVGVSNYGNLYYTVNKGFTNSETFLLFMVKLCEHLHHINQRWRDDTVIMLDNAPYHRSKQIRSKLDLMKVPLMYLGPYQFKMAPAEVFFSFIKG
jgi:DDE superfamily endonuclease